MIRTSGPPSILVVEDEPLLRIITVEELEGAGYTVIAAETGDQGVDAITAGATIVGLVTDVQTPGDTDGFALARLTHELYPEAAILLVSGRMRPGDGELPDGAVFIGKPYTAAVVIEALDKLLRHRL